MKAGRRKPTQPPRVAGRTSSGETPAAAGSPGRRWLIRLLAICIPLLVVFGGGELLLRALGYGYDPHYFKRTVVEGRECYVANQDFGLRFFPRSLVRFPPPVVMPAVKPPDTFRIFIFGESAALGDPRPNFGAACYLDALLRARFPRAKFEVINTSMTAINSHAILPIAQECAQREGNLWLIYMGNNEMVGSYGAVTVFGAKAPPLWLARAQLQLRRSRLCQLLFAAAQKLQKSSPAAANWRGMEMFVQNQVAPGDPSRERVYRNFERNLGDILQTGLRSGVKIVLSTVAVNLKDCPPFGSSAEAGLTPAKRAVFDKACQDGLAAQAQGQFSAAEAEFARATEISPNAAEAQYQLAACWLRQSNATAAWPHFQKAADTDTLPFRADARINESIRAAARSLAGPSLSLCDAAEELRASSRDGIPGDDLFYEHVHFNPDGNYALALAWARQVEKLLSPALKDGAQPDWASQAQCDSWLGQTDWNRVSVLEQIVERVQHPPFSGQSGQAQRVARLQEQITGLRHQLTDAAAAQAEEIYAQALHREPENFRLHENYAEFLEARHDFKTAIVERKKVCELTPQYYFPYYALGVDLKEAGDLAAAQQALLKANALKSDEGDVRLELGAVYAR
ncbi:MAG TPA: hypothetical protein VF988_10035, partial [Verrucomicrobiae bacterium]